MRFWNDSNLINSDKELLEQTYDSIMNVYCIEQEYIDGLLEEKESLLYENIPCGISFMSMNLTTDDDLAHTESTIKIFCSDDYDIPAGAVIIINNNNKSVRYIRVGHAKHYMTHQELIAIHQSR